MVGCVHWLGPGWDVSSVSGCLLARLGPSWSTVLIDQPAGNHETTSLVGVACLQSFVVVLWVSPAHTLVCLQCNFNKKISCVRAPLLIAIWGVVLLMSSYAQHYCSSAGSGMLLADVQVGS